MESISRSNRPEGFNRSVIDRRAALRLVFLGAATSVLAACASAPQQTASPPLIVPTTAPTTAATPTTEAPSPTASAVGVAPPATPVSAPVASAAQPKTGGSLTLSLGGDIPGLDGHLARGAASYESVWQVYETLTLYDQDLKPQPLLAESWDVSPDFKQIKFNLRKGVLWHSGREFTSDDVKWNVLRVRDPKIASTLLPYSNWFPTIETPDKYSVVFTADQPRPAMFDGWELFNMQDRETIEGPDAKTKAVGTGAFKLAEWVQGDHISFVKNTNYWRSNRPYLDGFNVRVLDPQAALVQLEAGTVDLVRSPQVSDAIRMKADPNYQVIVNPNPGTFFEFSFNVTNPPFDNKLVRQALNYAINRKRFQDEVFQGTNVAGALPWSSSSPGYDQVKSQGYGFNLEKSKVLLNQAGVTTLEADMVFISGAYPLLETFAQVYQNDVATLGVKLNLQPMASAAWIDAVINRKYNGLYAGNDNGANAWPVTLLTGLSWKDVGNNPGFQSPEWTQLSAAIASETDPVKQKQLYAQVNDYILDQSWVMPLGSNPITFVGKSTVQGMTPTLHQSFLLADTWISG
jgi:peptide/nickel transport system substrate-binding protein